MVHEQTWYNTHASRAEWPHPTEVTEMIVKGLMNIHQRQVVQRLPCPGLAQRIGETADVIPRHMDDARLRREVVEAEAVVAKPVCRRWDGLVVGDDIFPAVWVLDSQMGRQVFRKGRGAASYPEHVPCLAVGRLGCDVVWGFGETFLEVTSSGGEGRELVLEVGVPIHVVLHDEGGGYVLFDDTADGQIFPGRKCQGGEIVLSNGINVTTPGSKVGVRHCFAVPALQRLS